MSLSDQTSEFNFRVELLRRDLLQVDPEEDAMHIPKDASLPDFLGQPVRLVDYLAQCEADPDNGAWMVYRGDDYTLETLLYPVTLDTSAMEPEEYMEAEDRVIGHGFANCLHSAQISDVLSHLKRQQPNYTPQDLERALNYYAEHDDFAP